MALCPHNVTTHLNNRTVADDLIVVTSSCTNGNTTVTTAGAVARFSWPALLATLLVLSTIFGNVLVLIAIKINRRLQNISNYFLASLAVTDLTLAVFVMPFGIVELVYGTFPLHPAYCIVWNIVDKLLCTCSIMHMCTLSVDRYLCIRCPLKFGMNKTKKRVALKIGIAWVMATAITVPMSLIYALTSTAMFTEDGLCAIPDDRLYMITGSIVVFYIPLVIMLVVLALTVRVLRQVDAMKTIRVADKSPKSHIDGGGKVVTVAENSATTTSTDSGIKNDCDDDGRWQSTMTIASATLSTDIDNDNDIDDDDDVDDDYDEDVEPDNRIVVTPNACPMTTVVPTPSDNRKNVSVVRSATAIQKGRHRRSERRAIKIMAIIFFLFVVLWLPFFVLNMAAGICPTCAFYDEPILYVLSYWLGYASSAVNPVCYTIFNPTFRRTFAKILTCNLKLK